MKYSYAQGYKDAIAGNCKDDVEEGNPEYWNGHEEGRAYIEPFIHRFEGVDERDSN